jgi:uncharacterized protein (DUF885 family)
MGSDPQFFFKSPDEIVTACRDIAKQPIMVCRNFSVNLPRLPYGVLPVPSYMEKITASRLFPNRQYEKMVLQAPFLLTPMIYPPDQGGAYTAGVA